VHGQDLCNKIRRYFVDTFRYAGPSPKFPAQEVSVEHELKDEEVLEITPRYGVHFKVVSFRNV
jgi:ribosome-interacting GTPase 1